MDDGGEAWLVQYEGFVSAAQRHYRFTAGWTNLVKQKGIRVGKPHLAVHPPALSLLAPLLDAEQILT